MLEGVQIEKVKIVGKVVTAQKREVQTVYQIDDGSGIIECSLWNSDNHQNATEIVPENEVKVVGQVKVFNNKRNITAFCVRVLANKDEKLYHTMSASVAAVSRKHVSYIFKLINFRH